MSKINIFNPGRGFVKSYDFSVSGLSVTPGCLFGCRYCYSPTILHIDLDTFKQGITPKHDMVSYCEALKKQVPKVVDKTVYANVMTDPYQPKTLPYTQWMLEAMLEAGLPSKLVLQTRSPLVVGSLDTLVKFGDNVRVNFTIETNDEAARKNFSPGAPGLEARWRAIKLLSEKGVPVCITATPTLPFIRDEKEPGGIDLYELDKWCDRIKELPTFTHLVVQEFHNGGLTKTSPEAYGVAENYDWFYGGKAYEYLKYNLRERLDFTVFDGMAGFAPNP